MSSIFTSVIPPTQRFSSQTSKQILPSTNSSSIIIKDKASSSPKSRNTNLSTISLIHNNENITFPVISCGQSINPKNPIGKPLPTKRGRKPLSKMPSTKKHIQNLTNQRAFRLRREIYVKDLETKNATLEALYHDTKNENKLLKERLRSLEKQFLKFGGVNNVENDFCGGVIGADGAEFNVNNNDKTDNSSYCNVVETSDTSDMFFTIEGNTHLYRNLENDNSNNDSCNSSFFITDSFYNNNKNNDKAIPSCETSSSASPSTPIMPLQQITGIGSNHMFYGTREEDNDIFFCKTGSDDPMMMVNEDIDDNDEVDDNEINNKAYDESHSIHSTTTTTTTIPSPLSPSQIEKCNMSRGSGNKIFFIPVVSSTPSLHSPSTMRFNNIVKNDDDSNSVVYNMDLIPSSVDDPSVAQWDLQSDYYPLNSSSVSTTSISPSESASLSTFGQNYPLTFKWVMADTCRGKQNDSGEA